MRQQVRRGGKLAWIITAAVVVLALAAAGAYVLLRPTGFDVQGTFELSDIDTARAGCIGQGGYSDITGHDQVVVTDAAGKTVAIGRVVKGTTDGETCEYTFLVPDVPSGLGFYGVEVGRRGRVQYNEEQIRQGVKLTLGSR